MIGYKAGMNTTPPSLGRIVLYRPPSHAVDKKVRPAMIIDVYTDDHRVGQDRVQLQVFTPSGDLYVDAAWSEQGDVETWFWPPRVAERPVKLEKPDDPQDADHSSQADPVAAP